MTKLFLNLAAEDAGKLCVPEKLTHQKIADRVGSSREMIGRIMQDLVIGGSIEVRDRTIVMNKQPPARCQPARLSHK